MISILIGDCRLRMKELASNSVDSVVCDPPYHLTSIVKRFGADNAAPAKVGKTGAYARHSTGFMGQKWDGGDIAQDPAMWAEVLRVLKPGGHLVAFSGTRTYHRMAVAIEDAGFEIRDQLAWVYGSGFPKSLDVSKAIDKAAYSEPLFETIRGHIREWKERRGHSNKSLNQALGLETNGCGMVRHWTSTNGGQHMIPSKDQWRNLKRVLDWPDCELDATYDAVKDGAERPKLGLKRGTKLAVAPGQANDRSAKVLDITEGATEAAQQWQGWGTALKPSWEPICLARKPLSEGSVAANVLRFGTGAINVDACRISADGERNIGGSSEANGRGQHSYEVRDLRGSGQEVEEPTGTGQVGDHLRAGVSQQVNEGANQSELEGRSGLVRDEDGIPPVDHRSPIGSGQGAAANSDAEGVSGAPASDGSLFGPPAEVGGARSPSQRGKSRQPAGEPGTDGLVGTQPRASGDGASPVSDASREQGAEGCARRGTRPGGFGNVGAPKGSSTPNGFTPPEGRWPSNICHDGSDEVLAGFPDVLGMQGGGRREGLSYDRTVPIIGDGGTSTPYGDSGSAARFFYCAKSSSDERGNGNTHPTVKPIALMRWLCRLVTPPGGTILDPFMGSGSTLIAADAEQFHAIGCELSPEYAAIAERRIRDAAGMFADVKVAA